MNKESHNLNLKWQSKGANTDVDFSSSHHKNASMSNKEYACVYKCKPRKSQQRDWKWKKNLMEISELKNTIIKI